MDMSSSERGWTEYESPLGTLTLRAGPNGIAGLHFPGRSPRLEEGERRPLPRGTAQLDEYFAGGRQSFELALDLAGTPLERLVWSELRRIPYGTTISYGELEKRIEPAAFPAQLEPYQRVRAAAAAVGRTPVPIVVPCHRVIGADGSLTGYGGGLKRKRALLDLERLASGGAPDSTEGDPQLAML